MMSHRIARQHAYDHESSSSEQEKKRGKRECTRTSGADLTPVDRPVLAHVRMVWERMRSQCAFLRTLADVGAWDRHTLSTAAIDPAVTIATELSTGKGGTLTLGEATGITSTEQGDISSGKAQGSNL